MKKATYIKCPRCELNYIKSTDKYCPVCLAELKLAGEPFEGADDDLELCPLCGQNFISSDQKMCEDCAKQKGVDLEYDDNDDEESNHSVEDETGWDEDSLGLDDDVELIPLSAMEEDEDDEDDDELEEEDSDKPKAYDDFESIYLDDDDYEDEDDEDDYYDDEDDDDEDYE